MTKLIIVGAPGPATLPPPFISDLQHWWDFTDASQVFQDVGGVTPSGDTDPILRVNNKGYDGQPLIDAASQLTYTVDLLPGINVGSNAGLTPLTTILNNALSTTGATVVIILRSQDGVTVNPLKWEFGGDVSQIQADIDGSGNWEVQFDLADERDTTKPVVTDELLSVYGAIAGSFLDYRAAGAPLQSGTSGYPVTDAGLTLTVGDFTGNIAEILIYDFKLSASQQAALDQRNNVKYDGLPEIITPPPAFLPPNLPGLQHWFDFTDPTQVFQDVAGVVPATNGSLIERINNKGFDGEPIAKAGPNVPTWLTGFVNGLPVMQNLVGVANDLNQIMTNGTFPGGLGWAMTIRAQNAVASHFPFGWGTTPPAQHGVFLDSVGPTWDIDASGSMFSTTKAVVNNEWVYVYGEHGPSVRWSAFASNLPEQTGLLGYSAIPPGTLMRIGDIVGEVGEVLVYDSQQTPTTRLAIRTYFDSKYGVMPF